jgi:putative transposase
MATTEIMQLHSAGEEPKPRFDYRGRHRYLITLETFEAQPLFAKSEHVRTILGALRDESIAHHFDVLIYSFLPTTLTLLVRGKEEGAHMKTFLSAFRAASAALLPAEVTPRLWRRTYRERVLRKTEELRKVIRDVAMNPVRAGLATSPLAYEYQGSFVDELRSLLPPPPRRPGEAPPYARTGGARPGPGGSGKGTSRFKPRQGGFKGPGGGFKRGSENRGFRSTGSGQKRSGRPPRPDRSGRS